VAENPREAFRSLSTFGGRVIRGTARAVERRMNELGDAGIAHVVGRLQLRCFQVLTSGTPVDKGTARSGWTPSTGGPTTTPITAPSDEGQAKAEAAQRFAENQAKAEELARTYRVNLGPAFLSNPVPWIVPLNMGTSSQAPSMFVEQGLATAVQSVNL